MTSEVDIDLLPSRLRYIADKTEPGIQRAGLRIAASVIEGLLVDLDNQRRSEQREIVRRRAQAKLELLP